MNEHEPRSVFSKQEQEPPTDEVTEVAPGVLRIMLPVHMPGLGHVNCYVLEDERGAALIDPGLPGESTWNTLVARLADIGMTVDNVHTVIATHSHIDHFGGAHRLRDETDAEVVAHETFRRLWEESEARENPDIGTLEDATDDDIEAFRERMKRTTPWGTKTTPPPADSLRSWISEGRTSRSFRIPEPNITVAEADVITLARREWIAVHTPGHTEDHLCLWDPEHGVMFSGDHVLPTITPHIGGMTHEADPLDSFFSSLRRMTSFEGVSTVLPAHGHPFEDLGGRAESIINHHEQRLEILRDAADDVGDGTVNEWMQRLFRERSWGTMAESETYAHLEHLRLAGQATAGERGGAMTYRVEGDQSPS